MSAELQAGHIVGGKFRLVRCIGDGGMGSVWSATHVVMRKPVALKFLKEPAAAHSEIRQRFLREARAVAAVRHPNVVQVHDVFEEQGLPVLVMDLLEGETLGDRLDHPPPLGLDEIAAISMPVLSAVGSAHAVGIVHRDLKPDNIFICNGEPRTDGRHALSDANTSGADPITASRVRVLDFGIAKLTALEGDAARTAAITGTGSILGTPYYMAPEQVFGEKDIDHRADVWSLGIILYECLTGDRPTRADNVGQVLKIIMTGRIPPLAKAMNGLPHDVTDLVDRMLAQDRARRPSSLHEVYDILARYTGVRAPAFAAPATLSESPNRAAAEVAKRPVLAGADRDASTWVLGGAMGAAVNPEAFENAEEAPTVASGRISPAELRPLDAAVVTAGGTTIDEQNGSSFGPGHSWHDETGRVRKRRRAIAVVAAATFATLAGSLAMFGTGNGNNPGVRDAASSPSAANAAQEVHELPVADEPASGSAQAGIPLAQQGADASGGNAAPPVSTPLEPEPERQAEDRPVQKAPTGQTSGSSAATSSGSIEGSAPSKPPRATSKSAPRAAETAQAATTSAPRSTVGPGGVIDKPPF